MTEPALPRVLIRELTVRGFKSHRDAHAVELRPLTILAGANSSGKSSLMQALLLLKQTIDAPFDPGPLRLDGPNVQFTDLGQLLWRCPGEDAAEFEIAVDLGSGDRVRLVLAGPGPGVRIRECGYRYAGHEPETRLRPDRPPPGPPVAAEGGRPRTVERWRSFLVAGEGAVDLPRPARVLTDVVTRLFHLPGLRGNPARRYPVAAIGPRSAGLFPDYAASFVLHWTDRHAPESKLLNQAMRRLGLTWKVIARRADAVGIEVLVARTAEPRRGGARDLVNIADTGFGLSQTLPVAVALVAAGPDNLVYLEEPEIHLHPRGQVALGDLVAEAVDRGAQVVVETHSDLLLLALQRSVARQALAPERMVAHWFARDRDGATRIRSAGPDASGALGDWPVDFDAVSGELDNSYFDAALARLPKAGR